MTHDEEVYLGLGREVIRMIRDLQVASQADPGYALRRLSFPDGEVHVFVVNSAPLAAAFEAAAGAKYNVVRITPPSQVN